MRWQVKNKILLASICVCIGNAYAEVEPPKIGNFSLPFSQQPGPLLSLGQNMLAQGETQLFLLADDYAGVNKHSIAVIPSVLYGITDALSIYLNAPVAASYQQGSQRSAGLEDAFAQVEYAYFDDKTASFTHQATIVTNMTLPTGSIDKNPTTGYGSPSFFFGTTYNRTYVDWFVFGSPGVVLTTAKSGTKFGNSYLYQFGFGRNITDKNGWILAWMAEVDGTYSQRNRVRGVMDPNSGGNVVYVTPSLWASTKKLILQFGVGLPATQHLLGNQSRDSYLIAANVGWSIY